MQPHDEYFFHFDSWYELTGFDPDNAMNNTATHDGPFQREIYFFYGTLMDRSVMSSIITKPYRLELEPAQVTGWICKMWGEYPVLLAGRTDEIVHGMACEIQRLTDRDRLFRYETSAYRIQGCCIELRNGMSVMGKTFAWDGDLEALREGSFELKEWVMKRL